jgi:hypothetical protein
MPKVDGPFFVALAVRTTFVQPVSYHGRYANGLEAEL